MEKEGFVYILTNHPNGTLYIGVTSDLVKRVWEHRRQFVPGFTRKYNLRRLVYYENAGSIVSAIEREKQLKGWRRDWKVQLIEAANPGWRDLYREII